MAKKEIRSKYIKNLVEDAASTSSKIEDATKSAVESLLESTINKSLRKYISEQKEDENEDSDFEEKDLTATDGDTEEDEKDEETPEVTDTEEEEADEGDTETDDTMDFGDDDEGEESDWTDFEQFKDEDGEYDLTGQDDETVYRVLKAMDPEKDGIRLVKGDDGKFTLTDDNTDQEYIIDLGCEDGECEAEVESVTEIDEDKNFVIDDYQSKTAMTTPGNGEPSKFGRTWDKVPTGTGKPWVGAGSKSKGHPYDNTVSEDCCEMDECGQQLFEIELEDDMDECGQQLFEIEMDGNFKVDGELPMDDNFEEPSMDEAARTSAGHAVHRAAGTKTVGRQGSATSFMDSYTKAVRNDATVNENIVRKAKAIVAENKELKGFASKINEKLQESAVINASLAKIVKLMTENSTTREEKDNIVNRFSKVETLNECNKLYETISEELKNRKFANGSRIPSDKPLTESKGRTRETKLLDSSEATDVKSFMARLDKIK